MEEQLEETKWTEGNARRDNLNRRKEKGNMK